MLVEMLLATVLQAGGLVAPLHTPRPPVTRGASAHTDTSRVDGSGAIVPLGTPALLGAPAPSDVSPDYAAAAAGDLAAADREPVLYGLVDGDDDALEGPSEPIGGDAADWPPPEGTQGGAVLGDPAAGRVTRAASFGHAVTDPTELGLGALALVRAEATVADQVARGAFPGAALAIGRGGHTVIERGFGRMGWDPASTPVDPDRTIYDLASLTKVVATTTAVMLLVEDGVISLDTQVSAYLPEFGGGMKELVTIRDLLTHTSGLPAGSDLWALTPEESLRRAFATPLVAHPGRRVEYSDIGFIILWEAAEAAAGEPLYRLLDRRVFGPLGMMSTTFLPGEACGRCAPTGRRPDGTPLSGIVHDPLARRVGGITGNAGLFSTVHDIARFAGMLANGGELNGVRVLEESTVRSFAERQPGAATRALGWDTPDPLGRGAAGLRISPAAFGHTGFTGTSLWIDPERGTWVVLLSNRTYEPRGRNTMQAVRREVHDWVAAAAEK